MVPYSQRRPAWCAGSTHLFALGASMGACAHRVRSGQNTNPRPPHGSFREGAGSFPTLHVPGSAWGLGQEPGDGDKGVPWSPCMSLRGDTPEPPRPHRLPPWGAPDTQGSLPGLAGGSAPVSPSPGGPSTHSGWDHIPVCPQCPELLGSPCPDPPAPHSAQGDREHGDSSCHPLCKLHTGKRPKSKAFRKPRSTWLCRHPRTPFCPHPRLVGLGSVPPLPWVTWGGHTGHILHPQS